MEFVGLVLVVCQNYGTIKHLVKLNYIVWQIFTHLPGLPKTVLKELHLDLEVDY